MNAMVNLVVRLEKELDMQREGRTLPKSHDFERIKPTHRSRKTERRVVTNPVRESAPCPCPPCPASTD